MADAPVDGAPVEVLVRPEELTLSPLADGEAGASGVDGVDGVDGVSGVSGVEFAATVVDISYTGHDAMLTLVAGELRLRARVTAAGLLPVGSRVGVRVAGRVLAYSARA
ncbi:TOBE domain-containing protein [Agromyces bauzanensis]